MRGSVVEWTLTGEESPGTLTKPHPYHQHMSHFQVVAIRSVRADDDATTTSLVHVGDWRDTLVLYGGLSYTVRFVAPFLGLMMVHCHIQKHADMGMLALARIEERAAGDTRHCVVE